MLSCEVIKTKSFQLRTCKRNKEEQKTTPDSEQGDQE